MGDGSPTYELTIVQLIANPSFNPESLKRRPYDPEPSYLESTQFHRKEMTVTLTAQQYDQVKKSVLENWA